MTLKNPALLGTGNGIGFLDYWFFRTGKDGEYEACSGGEFITEINTTNRCPDGVPFSAYTFFPKTEWGFLGAVGDFENSEDGRLYQVGFRDLASYVCDNDKYFNINTGGLPDGLAKDWKKYAGEIVKL